MIAVVADTAPVLAVSTVTDVPSIAETLAPEAIPVPDTLSPTFRPDVDVNVITVAADADVAEAVVPDVVRSAPVLLENRRGDST